MVGCDGNRRVLNVNCATDGIRPLFSRSTTIYTKSGNTVTNVVSAIANELGMTAREETGNAWHKTTKQGYTFMMSISPTYSGWTIYLDDWPTTSRSDESRLAERRIREELSKK